MTEQTNLVPKRRFKEFQKTHDWEERKLGDMGKTFTGLSGKTKKDFGHGSAEYVTYMNVFSNSISDTSMTENVEVDSKQNELQYGDVLFTTSSETPQEVGMSSIWLGSRPNVYLNSFCFGYRPSVKVNYLFLAYLLRSNTVRKQMMLLAQGISRYNISKNKVMELRVGLPDIKEQEKIGKLFKQLDHTIALHQRKLEKTKALKSAYLSEMFPAEGEREPKRRFAGFTGDWEQRKLGDITNYIKGFAFKSTDYKETGVRIIRVSDLSKDDIKDSDDNTFIDFDDYHSYEKYRINHEDIIITTVGSKAEMKESAVGRPIIIKSTEDYLLNQNLVKINPKKEYESYFIYYQLLQPKYSNYLAMIERGNANQANIAINDLWEYVLQAPSKEEQTKIGNFFKQLDSTIALHQRKLEKLQNIKIAYLNEMFV